MRAAAIVGLGTALPETVVTNDDLAAWLDTSDDWIVERSGIRQRRIASGRESSVTLGATAAAGALETAGLAPADVELLLVATATPMTSLPGDAARLQEELGLSCGGFDVGAACAGFVHALIVASGYVGAGLADTVLVVGAETLSRVVDPTDRSTAVLFGDAAGAVVVAATPVNGAGPGLLGWDAGCDGAGAHLLQIPPGESYLRMDGPEVFRRAVRAMADSTRSALDQAKLTVADVDVFVPHQANARIIEATAQRLGISPARTVVALADTGNTSAASIPLALAAGQADGRLQAGAVVALTAVGAGLSWATAILRWGRP